MQEKTNSQSITFQVCSIGQINREKGQTFLKIDAPYRAGLEKLDQFSHVQVFWWADRHDNETSRSILKTALPYAEGVQAGVFACRSEYRPNPVALTPCPIVDVNMDTGTIIITDIDAEDGSHILDLKPYIPVCDRIRTVTSAPWFHDWPEWLPESGLALQY